MEKELPFRIVVLLTMLVLSGHNIGKIGVSQLSDEDLESLSERAVAPNDPYTHVGDTDPYTVYHQPLLPLQPVGRPFRDPVFNTLILRVADAPERGYERHEYSQLQAFNADSTLVLLDKNGLFIVRDVTTLHHVSTLPGDINVPRWNPANPNEVIHFDSNDVGSGNVRVVIQATDVRTGNTADIVTFPDTYERVATAISWEELSRDGRWITALLYRTDGNEVFVSYDLVNRLLGAQLTLNGDLYGGRCGPLSGGPNWVAPSPTGRYMVIQWNRDGTEACSGVEAYDIQTGAYRGHVGDHRQHSDMGFDENGSEIYLTSYYRSSNFLTTTRFPGSPNFSNGYDKIILDPGWNHMSHISCQGPAGVCVITADGRAGEPFDGEIYLVYTSGIAADDGQNDNARVRRLAHHRSDSECGYYSQPQASLSADGRYVIYASNWGSCMNGDDGYIIDLTGEVMITPAAPTTLLLELDSSTEVIGFLVEIRGRLSSDSEPLPTQRVDLAYSVNDGETWLDLASPLTDLAGQFTAQWLPAVTGYYTVVVHYAGNQSYLGTSSSTHLAVTPYQDRHVFSVISNSTLTELQFESTRSELRFVVSGPEGTRGFTTVTMSKQLVDDVSQLEVLLDGVEIAYEAYSSDDSWKVEISYEHSSRIVTVKLPAQEPEEPTGTELLRSVWDSLPYVALISVVIAVSLWGLSRRRSAP